MKHQPPIEHVTSTLRMIGVQLQPDHVTQILGWVPLLAASVLTFWGVLAKVKSDKQTTITDALRQDNAALRAELSAIRQDYRQADHDRDKAEHERDEALSELRQTVGVTRDQAQLILAMSRDLMARISWDGTPPPPDLSWRTSDYLTQPGDT